MCSFEPWEPPPVLTVDRRKMCREPHYIIQWRWSPDPWEALHNFQISGSRWILRGRNSGDKGKVGMIWAITEATFSFEVN